MFSKFTLNLSCLQYFSENSSLPVCKMISGKQAVAPLHCCWSSHPGAMSQGYVWVVRLRLTHRAAAGLFSRADMCLCLSAHLPVHIFPPSVRA